jgi:hypothetical protein
MSSKLDELSAADRAAYDIWIGGASRSHFGRCASCGRTHDDQGRHLLVARQPRRRIFECFDCWRRP